MRAYRPLHIPPTHSTEQKQKRSNTSADQPFISLSYSKFTAAGSQLDVVVTQRWRLTARPSGRLVVGAPLST